MLSSCLEQAADVGSAARKLGAKPVLLGNDVHGWERARGVARSVATHGCFDSECPVRFRPSRLLYLVRALGSEVPLKEKE